MKYDVAKAQLWLKQAEGYLPGFSQLLQTAKSPILIVGASVCEIYQFQEWIPPFRRRTGDVDLSVGLTSSGTEQHQSFKQQLIELGYKEDLTHPYRFHSPKAMPHALGYIDLLADPVGPAASTQQAQRAMGVSEGFTLKGFSFARKQAFHIFPQVTFPNPFGFLALKREGYLDEPARRIKDLADIVEVTSGLVEKGAHFEIEGIWNLIKQDLEAQNVRRMLTDLGQGESVQWDLDNVADELARIGFTLTDISETIPRRLKDFADVLG